MAALSVGLFVATDLFHLVVAPLVVATPLTRADAIVVFGGGLTPDGRLGNSTGERIGYAAELYGQGLAEYVVISGGYRVAPRFEEAQAMAAGLIRLGVPRDRILIDRRARNTFENARQVYALCVARGFTRVILVTSPYHMQRAVRCLRRYPLTVSAAPVAGSEIYRPGLGARIRALDLVVHEYGGLLGYWWRGWI
jgi:uncharacterized SAM-binding protein YcdF (DUF218 family)